MIEKALEADAEVWLDRGSKRFLPGEVIAGKYRLENWYKAGLVSYELSVLWLTAGVGEEDICVHHFERQRCNEVSSSESAPKFQTTLPLSPMSHDGQIVKVCWLVRLRGFFAEGRERTVEVPFWLLPPVDTQEPIYD